MNYSPKSFRRKELRQRDSASRENKLGRGKQVKMVAITKM
jgi:hypothetical protein